jgi:hypothetical protein
VPPTVTPITAFPLVSAASASVQSLRFSSTSLHAHHLGVFLSVRAVAHRTPRPTGCRARAVLPSAEPVPACQDPSDVRARARAISSTTARSLTGEPRMPVLGPCAVPVKVRKNDKRQSENLPPEHSFLKNDYVRLVTVTVTATCHHHCSLAVLTGPVRTLYQFQSQCDFLKNLWCKKIMILLKW